MARIVKLNVGGTRYETSISTVMQHPNSMLGAMIQKPREEKMIESGEELFIDRDGDMFKYILRYLRDGEFSLLPDGESPGDLAILKQLLLEAQFFSLDGLKAMIEAKLQTLTRDGWKIGDIVTRGDLATVGTSLNCGSSIIGPIVQFRSDGTVAVRSEFLINDYGHQVSIMYSVMLEPKRT